MSERRRRQAWATALSISLGPPVDQHQRPPATAKPEMNFGLLDLRCSLRWLRFAGHLGEQDDHAIAELSASMSRFALLTGGSP
jgi:hypothetical protein